MSLTTVLLVDDHSVVRQGLRALLQIETDIQLVGEATDGREAVALARRTWPQVVLMDIAMPRLNGVDATRQILKHAPTCKILALTSYGDEDCLEQMVRAGAVGFLVKQSTARDLVRAIREARNGKAFFSPEISKFLRRHWVRTLRVSSQAA